MSLLPTSKKQAGRPALPDDEKRLERVELRLTRAEKRQLCLLSKQINVPMTTLLIEGALGCVNALPQFQRLPPDLMQPVTTLQQVAGQLFSFAHRLVMDERTQDQVRGLVFTLGDLSNKLHQQLTQTALPANLIRQLNQLQAVLASQPQPTAEQRELLRLLADVLDSYPLDKTL